jgi:F-type H+-transporting ATPase subunit delta
MINKKVARRYTLALFEIGEEMKSLDVLIADFVSIRASIDASKELQTFLSTPLINSHKKEKVIRALFEGKVSETTLLFLELLCRKNREMFLHDISIDFPDLVNEKRGILSAKIKTAVEITEQEKKTISEKLEAYSGKKIDAKFSVDPSIKGGFVANIDDTIIDASIKRQLELLYDNFRKGSFSTN